MSDESVRIICGSAIFITVTVCAAWLGVAALNFIAKTGGKGND